MTGENRQRNARDELEKAESCLKEARALRRAGLPYGTVSRSYYVAFHAARATLFSIGLEATSHRSVVSMLGEHFVRPGRLAPGLGRLISRMQRDREDADYSAGAVFTEEDADRAIADAETFLAACRDLVNQAPD